MERELKQTKAELDAKNTEIKTMKTTADRNSQDLSKLESQLKEQKVCLYLTCDNIYNLCATGRGECD